MARISAKETLAALKGDNPPRLAIIGSAKATEGRTHVLMKIRPSTVHRVHAVALGPMYLILEHALMKLCDELESMPPGMVRTIDAAIFNASPEDIAEVEAAKARVVPGKLVNRSRKKGEPVWIEDVQEPVDALSPDDEPAPAAKEFPHRGNAAAKAAYVSDDLFARIVRTDDVAAPTVEPKPVKQTKTTKQES